MVSQKSKVNVNGVRAGKQGGPKAKKYSHLSHSHLSFPYTGEIEILIEEAAIFEVWRNSKACTTVGGQK